MEEEVNKGENKPELKKAEKDSIIKVASGSLPLLTVILVALGLSKQAMYYSNFNVPIKYFLGISELSLIISVDLLVAFATVFGTVIYIFINREGFQKASPKSLFFFSKIFPVLAFLFTLGGTFIAAKTVATRLIWCCFLLGSFSYLFFTAYKSQIQKLLNLDNRMIVLIASVSISTLCLIMLKTGFDLIRVEKGLYNGTKIYTTDSIYTSTGNSYFIGKTENYIFIYNKKDSTTSIIPSELVTKMVLKVKDY